MPLDRTAWAICRHDNLMRIRLGDLYDKKKYVHAPGDKIILWAIAARFEM